MNTNPRTLSSLSDDPHTNPNALLRPFSKPFSKLYEYNT